MLNSWFILAVFVIPFNDVYGFLPLGELQNDLPAYLFLALFMVVASERISASGMAADRGTTSDPMFLLPRLAMVMLAAIMFSGLVNLPDLLGPDARGRSPVGK